MDMIESTYNQIYRNWLPFSEYTPTMDLDILVLDSRFAGRDEKNEVDILIPVTC
jgi:predicted transcriptional regulator YdeE